MRTTVLLLVVLAPLGAQLDPFDGRLQPVAPEPVSCANGDFSASGTWFGQLPSGTPTWFQAWMHEPRGA